MNEAQKKGEHGTCETVEIDGVVYNKGEEPVKKESSKEPKDPKDPKDPKAPKIVESTGSAAGTGGQK